MRNSSPLDPSGKEERRTFDDLQEAASALEPQIIRVKALTGRFDMSFEKTFRDGLDFLILAMRKQWRMIEWMNSQTTTRTSLTTL